MELIKIIRPQQWVKNLFVLIPVFFAGSMTHGGSVAAAALAMAAFSFAASSVYCFNDIIDADEDRRHPVKCRRPVASGAVSTAQAYALMALMAALAAAVVALLGSRAWQVAAVIGGYYALNIAYCAWLKRFAIIDVCVIAFGFVLRILAGGLATGIGLSKWIVLMTFLLTLFLSLAKRRDDVLRMNRTGRAPRRNTSRYNLTFVNQAITITAAVTIVCYVMYTVSPEAAAVMHTDYLLRYLQIAVVDEKSGDPTAVALHDRFTQVTVACWVLSFIAIIYLS